MVSVKQIVILALSGTAMAVPAVFKRDWHYGQGHWHGGWGRTSASDIGYAIETVTEIAYDMPTATPIATVTGNNVPVVTATAPANTFATVTKTAASSSAPTATGSTGTGYMAIVDTWRGLTNPSKALVQDSKLEANALKTVKDSNGAMVHELNPGSMAQVLAPGNTGNFEDVYVGGWLCERPNLTGLNGICATKAQGWDHSDGETGHADILTSTSYSKIGCALYAGIWACDLA